MPDYLLQLSFAPEAVATLVANPQNREEVARSLIEKVGGKLKGYWFALGDYDVVQIATLPDDESAVALSMAVMAGGAVKAFKTTPLLSMDEGIEAMKKASGLGYKPPGK
ncbi:GYD domain-containing protein [Methanosarcina soligelidi]|uniref:GYD domain-containing protein n=1 Tax=Methanosarcina soligelidi TaxID=1036677 RepID=UPI00064EDD12|nr:GYD domain-containing protein [Methanosarcina soligelidi]